MYSAIQRDMDILVNKVYSCILMGYFNGYVGDGPDGIPGNPHSVNYNGQLLQDFIVVNKLKLINADMARTSGTFTRSSGGFSLILDYNICTREGSPGRHLGWRTWQIDLRLR